jgi:DNA-binding NarL/FixJ family response regulator
LGASTNASETSGRNSAFSMPIRRLIVDDNSSFGQEISALLEGQGIEVVGGAANGDEAIQQIAELRPDVALIDIDLGGENGLALARRLQVGAAVGQCRSRGLLHSLGGADQRIKALERHTSVDLCPCRG